MVSLARQVKAAVEADTVLGPLFGVRIFTDRTVKKAGFRATPEAFAVGTGTLLLSMVIEADGTVSDISTWIAGLQSLYIYVHAQNTEDNWATIEETVIPAIVDLVLDHQFTGPNGTGVDVGITDTQGVMESVSLPDAITDYVRIGATKLWR